MQAYVDKIVLLGEVNPQAAFHLLAATANRKMDYQARVTPPRLLACDAFDDMIDTAAGQILTHADYDNPVTSDERATRSKGLRCLSIKSGGTGQIPLRIKACCAYLSALTAVLDGEPDIPGFREQVARDAATTYEKLRTLTGETDLALNSAIAKVLPTSARALAAPPNPSRCSLPKHSTLRKIQRVLVNECDRRSRRMWIDAFGPMNELTVDNTHIDMAHNITTLTRSKMADAFAADLFYKDFRVQPVEFIMNTRYHLNLPPLLGPGTQLGKDIGYEGLDADRAVCNMDQGLHTVLEATCGHATSCKMGTTARSALHGAINRVIASFGREAGGVATFEPATSAVLLDELTPDVCRTLFPKESGPGPKARSLDMARMVNSLSRMGTSKAARAELARKIGAYASSTPNDWKGLRVDVRLVFPEREMLVDASSAHPTPPSTSRSVFLWAKRVVEAENDAGGILANSEQSRVPSPAVRTRARDKHTKYNPLMELIRQQHKRKIRPPIPKFYTAVVSHTGELASDFICLIEAVVAEYAKMLRRTTRHDGISDKRLTASFRQRFRTGIMTASMSGFGQVIKAVTVGSGMVSLPSQQGLVVEPIGT